ncbi:MAG: phospholipase [Gammaproteobacteria bacterium]|nr:phospholipase [Gammaproteobacteria bacterium]MDH3767358.1 phospholipase [Gammaproteobacteria bacterium]
MNILRQTLTMRWYCILMFVFLSACAYTPTHDIPVQPEFIHAGIEPGDEVEIITVDGRAMSLVVVEVEENAIAGEEERVAFDEIAKLTKRSWREPTHPCGAGRPVGCSIPGAVNAIDESAGSRFHPACARHDYCYRHGHATYGVDREACDTRFYTDLKAHCNKDKLFGVLSLGSLAEDAKCLAMAESMYQGVRRFGEDAFLIATSTYCPYDAQ